MASKEQVNKFISEIAPLVQKYAKERGYKIASTVIAQACCESAFGTCALSPYHNYFGLKCGKVWKGPSVNMRTKEEYQPGVLTNITDNFRVYSSMEEGVKGYYDFINWSHYANLKTATTYRQYAEFLKADGYATSSTYVSTLCKIVEDYGLSKWDDFNAVPESKPVVPPIIPSPITKEEKYRVCVNSFLRVRREPNTNSAVLNQLYNGTIVTISQKKDNWGYAKEYSGWVCLDYCKKTN